MNSSRPSYAKILVHSNGLGVPSTDLVRQRAIELAQIDGRTEYNEQDWQHAKQELHGGHEYSWDDDEDFTAASGYEDAQHRFGLASARRHDYGSWGIRDGPMCMDRMECTYLGFSEPGKVVCHVFFNIRECANPRLEHALCFFGGVLGSSLDGQV